MNDVLQFLIALSMDMTINFRNTTLPKVLINLEGEGNYTFNGTYIDYDTPYDSN